MNWGLRPASASVRTVASNSFQKRLVQLGRIWMHWEDILGAELAGLCQPAGLKSKSFAKTKDGKSFPTGFELQIACEPAQSMNITYKQDLILARISQILGTDTIQSLRIVPASAAIKLPDPFIQPSHPLTEREKTFLSEALHDISDAQLKERLEKIGTAILQKERMGKKPSPASSKTRI